MPPEEFLHKNAPIIYVDVDDTLVRSAGSKRIPITRVIEHIKLSKQQGAELYCWSSGGADYAKASATELDLANCFAGFLPKPNILIDDQKLNDWKYLIYVHPSECTHQELADYVKKLRT